MGNVVSISRVSELKREIAVIANCPKASKTDAVKFATALVASYPGHQWADPMVAKAFMRQLVGALEGVDLDIINALVSPRSGLVATSKRLPNVAEVLAFIDNRFEPKRRAIDTYLEEIRTLEGKGAEEVLTEEERARRAENLKKLSKLIRDTAAARRMGQSSGDFGQRLAPASELIEGLENLEAQKNGGDIPVLD